MVKHYKNTFKTAVEATPDIKNCYQTGLKALGAYSIKVSLADNKLCNGSVDIDKCVKDAHHDSNRWDYCIGYNDKAYFVEVHPASSSDVKTMLNKLNWLKDWLTKSAPELDKIKASPPFYWLQTTGYSIPFTSRQYKAAVQAGIKPTPRLELK